MEWENQKYRWECHTYTHTRMHAFTQLCELVTLPVSIPPPLFLSRTHSHARIHSPPPAPSPFLRPGVPFINPNMAQAFGAVGKNSDDDDDDD